MDIGGAAKDGGSVCAMFWIRVFDANLREFYKRPHRF